MEGIKIVRQQTDSRHGNDCLIVDTLVEFEVHSLYVVEVIRRYHGWCDHGMDFRSRKEFDNQRQADDYYEDLATSVINR